MRVLRVLPVVLALGVAVVPAASASPTTTAVAATTSITVSPVTSAGHPAPGYTAHAVPGDVVDCSSADPSPGAVDPNIEECSPSAAYAVACWKAAKPHHVLCLQNARSHELQLLKRSGKFAKTAPATAARRSPLMLVLTDGTKCSIRIGGAVGPLKGHPQWDLTYFCAKHGDVWAKPHATHEGVNESSSTWTVHTAPASGKVTVRAVKKAYFVGTAS